jgi:hypothetical protein
MARALTDRKIKIFSFFFSSHRAGVLRNILSWKYILNTVSKWDGKSNLAVVFDTLPNILHQAGVSHGKGSD